jgi:hypothetical protein
MAKKGELKPVDAHEQQVRDNAVSYNVVMYTPASSDRERMSCLTLDMAKECGKDALVKKPYIRSVMIYAVNEYQNHVMVGSIGRDLKWKEVIPARY